MVMMTTIKETENLGDYVEETDFDAGGPNFGERRRSLSEVVAGL